jgi:tRNA(fMet)-specific endonuclease VapC
LRILDSDTCIGILRGQQNVIARRITIRDEVAITWIAAGELCYGAAKSRDPVGNRLLVEQFLNSLSVLDSDVRTSEVFGILRAELESRRQRLSDADLWVGAIARVHRATVVTRNARNFVRMGIATENWLV